jgi:hypothetical protein
MLASSENAHDLVALNELIESGAVTPVIDLAPGYARGKVVITV